MASGDRFVAGRAVKQDRLDASLLAEMMSMGKPRSFRKNARKAS